MIITRLLAVFYSTFDFSGPKEKYDLIISKTLEDGVNHLQTLFKENNSYCVLLLHIYSDEYYHGFSFYVKHGDLFQYVWSCFGGEESHTKQVDYLNILKLEYIQDEHYRLCSN